MISQPSVTLNIIPAKLQVSNAPHRVLIVGQMIAAGTAVSGQLYQNIADDNSWNTLFGVNSMISTMIREFRAINPVTALDAIALADNGAGVKATGTLAFTGPSSQAGTLTVVVGSQLTNLVTVAVGATDTATTVATNVAAAINADPNTLVVATASTGTVTLTAVNAGTFGNHFPVQVTGLTTGLGLTITGMGSATAGATDPSLTTLWNPITNVRYNTVVYPGNWPTTTATAQFEPLWNVTNAVQDGQIITCKADTYANLLSGVSAYNYKTLVLIGNKKITAASLVGGAIIMPSVTIAAQFAAIRALRLTLNANIAAYVISNQGANDSFGGPAIASLPYFNTPFYNLPVVAPGNDFLATEVNALVAAGVAVLGNNITGTQVIAGAIPTNYHTDVAGNPDTSFQFLEYVDTISQAREYMYNNLKSRFAQSRLTQGDLLPGRSMANPSAIQSYLDQLYTDLSGQNYCLTQAGETALQFFKSNRTVTLNMTNGTATVLMVVPIVVQLRTILATMQLSFSASTAISTSP